MNMADSVWKVLYDRLSEYRANVTYDDMYRDIEPAKPLRLSGGKSDEDPPLSPYFACKSILDDFDTIIKAYKKAVGPCGKGECPFTMTLANLNCKKDGLLLPSSEDKIRVMSCTDLNCPFSLPENKGLEKNRLNMDESVPLNYCGMTECPFAQRNTIRNETQVQAACGDPKCAFTKIKMGLIDDETKDELAFLPSPDTGYCGKPKCKHPVMLPSLPPIHWECPEPLPKGACTNPNCPFLPPDLRALQALVKRGTCDSPSCTNMLPEDYRRAKSSKTKSKKPAKTVCDNPHCPYQNPDGASLNDEDSSDVKGTIIFCENPECPYQSYKSPATDYCDNPKCPTATKNKNKVCEDDIPSVCSVPDCPYNKLSQLLTGSKSNICSKLELELQENICDNPDCPMKTQTKNKDKCNNPTCSNSKKKAASVCNNPSCPIAQSAKQIQKGACSNPACPIAQKAKQGQNGASSVCSNPACPIAQNAKQAQKGASSVCSNPACPIAESAKQGQNKEKTTCDNPDYPSKKSKKKVCYEDEKPKTKEVCGNPECPFKQKTIDDMFKKLEAELATCTTNNVCGNPSCPFASTGGEKSDTGERVPCTDDLVCENPDCPFVAKKSCICEPGNFCSNPFCQFYGKSKDPCEDPRYLCANPDCPHTPSKLCKDLPNPCGLPTCPYSQPEPSCEDPCSELKACDNPLCPYYGKVKSSICDNPDCPYQNYPLDEGEDEGEEMLCDQPCSYERTCGHVECPFYADLQEVEKLTERIKSKKTSQKSGNKSRKPGQSGKVADDGKRRRRNMIPGYEGTMLGHKDCLTKVYHVPKNMGWLWNLTDPLNLRRRGFRPGAVAKNVANRIMKHKKMKALEKQQADPFVAEKKQTLTVTKKQGEYVLTVNPLKDPKSLRYRNESVYMDCTPIQFRIKKNKDPLNYSSCICDDGEVVESTSSDSLELAFSPTGARKTAAFFDSKRPTKPVDTQYDPKDVKAGKGKDKKGKDKKGKKGKGKGKGKSKGKGKGKKK